MNIRKILAAALVLSLPSIALAASGTPAQQDACRPDVRHLCHKLAPDAGDDAFLKCLQANRAKLSAGCRGLLESNGQ